MAEDYTDRGVIDLDDLPRRACGHALTDLGNGEYFRDRHGDDLRYDHRRGRWLLWRDHRWQPDADAEIRRLAAAAMRCRLREAADLDDESTRARAIKWAVGSETRARIEALLWFAQSLAPIADDGEHWDRDAWLLGVPNGVVDLRLGTLRAGRRDDRLTLAAGVAFDPDATCLRWERFLDEVFMDSDLVAFIHRALGYSLTGITHEQCLFLNYGTGANGKSSLLDAIGYVLGDYSHTMPFSTIELHQRSAIPNDLAALAGRRFVTASETNDGTRLNESRIKALTGGDPITARFLHSEFFSFHPVAKFWLGVNHKPVVTDDSPGFWRRMRLLPFARTFPVDATLGAELREEAPGILAWAVRGCLAWQQHGLTAPDVVKLATNSYREDSDPLAAFFAEACELDPQAEVGADDLFQHYRLWADRHGLGDHERLKRTGFGRKLGERLTHKPTNRGKVYFGIARKAE